jgi:large subunit ribosomal protein L7/L12
MANLDKLVEELSGLTLLEAAELKKRLEDAWGVTAAAPMAMAGAMPAMGMAPAGAEQAAEEEEVTEFNVMLTDIGPKKIQVIKAVRSLTNLGLGEAKTLVESAPSLVLESVPKEAAQDAKAKLEAEGAGAEIKPA